MSSLLARLNDQAEMYRPSGKNAMPLAMPKKTGGSSSSISAQGVKLEGEGISSHSTSSSAATDIMSVVEVQNMKAELDAARRVIKKMEQEASMSRNAQQTLDQLTDAPDIHSTGGHVSEQTIANLQHRFNTATRPTGTRPVDGFHAQDHGRSELNDVTGNGPATSRGTTMWSNGRAPVSYPVSTMGPPASTMATSTPGWNNHPVAASPMPRRTFNVGNTVSMGDFRGPALQHGTSDLGPASLHHSMPNMVAPTRPASSLDVNPQYVNSGWRGYGLPGPALDPAAIRMAGQNGVTLGVPNNMTPMANAFSNARQVNRLSPTATDFDGMAPTPSWNSQVSQRTSLGPDSRRMPVTHARVFAQPTSENAAVYVQPTEPMNYRRLLDRNMNANWRYIVDKIVCNNDQQASIFLQQKLKVGTAEQKFAIVEAIIRQCFLLMTNRFGNFLVQRCFEHGTYDQIVAIANAIRGNVLTLSMDAFGCHVIQKAFDAVPEEYKAIMVHELLRRIPETVVHRYACHVWQKLFELRWSDTPPQIMKYVNEALQGMWHEVALGETGSLVVQNIFENCLEEDKVSCISSLPSLPAIQRLT
jgi:hypothetical protein